MTFFIQIHCNVRWVVRRVPAPAPQAGNREQHTWDIQAQKDIQALGYTAQRGLFHRIHSTPNQTFLQAIVALKRVKNK